MLADIWDQIRVMFGFSPSPRYEFVRHVNDNIIEFHYTKWEMVRNPRYAGNIFQQQWYWKGHRCCGRLPTKANKENPNDE